MKAGRLWRTVRHVRGAQLAHRVWARARRAARRWRPDAARARYRWVAAELPRADPAAPGLAALARHALALQCVVHGDRPGDVAQGRFTLLNEAFDFGAPENIDWRGDFREGDNPLRRMILSYMGALVPLLARGRAEDLACARAMLDGFETANGWRVPGVFGDVWHPYAASHRLINLLAGLALYRGAGEPADGAAEAAILDHARLCAAFVGRNLERDVQYNHLMKNLVALATYAAAAPGVRPPPVTSAVLQCVLWDGGHAERGPMYHALALTDFRMLRDSGLYPDVGLDRVVESMEAALAAMRHPDGDIALFGDSWAGEADLYPLANMGETMILPDSGYARIGRGGDAVILRCGACGPDDNMAHAHADMLAIEVSTGGDRLIVDPGVATYTAGVERDDTRCAARHNGPRLAGEEPLEFWGSFRVGRRAKAKALTSRTLAGFAPLWCAGARRGARRFVGLWPGAGLMVCDWWTTAEPGESRFLIPARWRLNGDQPDIRATALAGTLGPISPDHHYERYGVAEDAHRLTLEAQSGRAALWLTWSDDAAAPSPDDINALIDRLAAC